MEFLLKHFNDLTTHELYGILKLRVEIFVVEQDCVYQDLDDKDYDAYHLFAVENDMIVAALRILPRGLRFDEVSIGRLVVQRDFRGQGISRKIMLKAMDFIMSDLGESEIRLSGQAYLSCYYESLGFEKVSDSYLEDGIKHYEFLYVED